MEIDYYLYKILIKHIIGNLSLNITSSMVYDMRGGNTCRK